MSLLFSSEAERLDAELMNSGEALTFIDKLDSVDSLQCCAVPSPALQQPATIV